jgi:hypothetical protein
VEQHDDDFEFEELPQGERLWQVHDRVAAQRKRLLAAGYLPLPINGKVPPIHGWQDIIATPAIIDRWTNQWPDSTSTGLLTRTAPAIDVDIMHPEAAAAVEALARERFEEHGRVLVRFGRAPKRALLFRTDEPFKKITRSFSYPSCDPKHPPKIEILANGQQVVAFGTHPETKRDYSWHGGEPGEIRREDLPYVREDDMQAFLDAATELLVKDFGFTDCPQSKSNGKDDGEALDDEIGASWSGLVADILAGRNLHDSIRDLAASVVASGVNNAAAERLLHALMQASTAPHDERWQQRYDDILRAVDSARRKFGQEEEWEDGAQPPSELGEHDAGDDIGPPPPRGWLFGNTFCRKFLSSLLGDGGVGKTALRYAQYLSLAVNRALTGEYVFERARVLIISLEDDIEELQRRMLAAMIHHGIDRADLKGWLFYAAPGAAAGKLMTVDRAGRALRGRLAASIEAAIIKHNIDLVAIDPFVKSHSVPENENSIIDEVAQVLTDLAARHNIAIDSPHHISKGPAEPGNANRGRGASAMVNAGRLVFTLTTMSSEEAKAFGIAEIDRKQFVRVDSGKVNITKAAGEAKWFRIVGVRLGNVTELYPYGDEVQTVEPWKPPEVWGDLSIDLLNQALTQIDAGLPDGNRYSDSSHTREERAAWRLITTLAPNKTEAQAREIIKTWVKNGVLVRRDYRDPKQRKDAVGLYVDHAKRPSKA